MSHLALKVIVATADHFEDVLGLSEGVYNGLDYLPAAYHSYIREAEAQRQRRFNYVAFIEEEMVGFFSILFNSDLSNYMVSALRVSTQRRGLGLGMKLLSYYEREKALPGVSQLTSFANFVMSDKLFARVIQSQGGPAFPLNCRALHFIRDVERPSLSSLSSDLSMVEKSFLLKVLSPPWSSLLPSSVLHIMFDPFMPTSEEDLVSIIRKDITVVAGPDSFSIFSNPLTVPVGSRICIDVFARTRESFIGKIERNSVLERNIIFSADHLRYQLNHFLVRNAGQNLTDGQLILFIFTQPQYWDDLVKFVKEELKVTEDLFISNNGPAIPVVQFCVKKIN